MCIFEITVMDIYKQIVNHKDNKANNTNKTE